MLSDVTQDVIFAKKYKTRNCAAFLSLLLAATFDKIPAKPSNLIDETLLNKFRIVIEFVCDVWEEFFVAFEAFGNQFPIRMIEDLNSAKRRMTTVTSLIDNSLKLLCN